MKNSNSEKHTNSIYSNDKSFSIGYEEFAKDQTSEPEIPSIPTKEFNFEIVEEDETSSNIQNEHLDVDWSAFSK